MGDITSAIKRLRRMITHLEQLVAELEAQNRLRDGVPSWNDRSEEEAAELNRLLKIDLGAGVPPTQLAEKYCVPVTYVSRLKRQLRRGAVSSALCLLAFGRELRLAVEQWPETLATIHLPAQLASFL